MTKTYIDTPPVTKQVSILIGCGDQTYGVVSLVEDGTLTIDGHTTRITRLLANIRRLRPYRAMTNEQFFAVLPEALCEGHTWVMPADEVVDANGITASEPGME